MDARLERFLKNINELGSGSLNLLNQMYTDDISFQDPLHEIQGLASLKRYFTKLYKNTEACQFEWDSRLMLGNEAMVAWQMELTHRLLNGGRPFRLAGASLLRFQNQGDLVQNHRDYFDAGSLLYERIPILGSVIRTIKSQV